MIEPRPYQAEAVNAVLDEWRGGVTRQIISLPTGAGKTIIFGLLAEKFGRKTLVLAHRDELLKQAVDKMLLINPNADIGIFKAAQRRGLNCEICVASVQTATRHISRLKNMGYELCICDEAHHSNAYSYQRIFRELGFTEGNLSRLLFGCTATAFRADGKPLGDVFEKITYAKTISEMICGGYLCDVRGIAIGTDIDLRGVRTRAGDFAVDELVTAVDIPERNALIASAYLRYCGGKKAVAFGVSVSHAQNIAAAFRERGVTCEVVWGGMDDDARKRVLEAFRAGEFQVLSNCMILTEGFDDPAVEAVLMARPTKSKALYIQSVGRGLRTSPGKTECLILDFVDITKKHDLCGAATLTGGKQPRPGQSFLEAIQEQNQEQSRAKSMTAPLRHDTDEGIDLFWRSRFNWMTVGGIYRLNLGNGRSVVCALSESEKGYDVLLVEGNGRTKAITKSYLPLELAKGVAEDFAMKHTQIAFIDKQANWRSAPASEKQLSLLRGMGIRCSPEMTKGQAAKMLDAEFNEPLTKKQLSVIQSKKLHPMPAILTKKEAQSLISRYYSRA